MQPISFAADIDAGLIGMGEFGGGQHAPGTIFKVSRQAVGRFVEVEYRTFTDRYLKLIGKNSPEPGYTFVTN